jgi:sulfatase maturation enzyme AslB (radical SAM superfamily)
VVKQLILTVTRACNLRCSYCPTAKDGWPSLNDEDARQAVRLFSDVFGGGSIKIFGGEPLLVPTVVRAAMEEARDDDNIRWVYLSTNGLGLNEEWLDYMSNYPKGILTISMDGAPEDHSAQRRAVHSDVPDSYLHLINMRESLLATPRVVVTQTIAPATAKRASSNLEHLMDLGFWRFNFLPGYYIPWRPSQLADLDRGFEQMAQIIVDRWERMERTYVRNLFTWAPTPFFNTGLVVDSDRSIHPSNVGLSGALDHTREATMVGTLDDPPDRGRLEEGARRVNGMLEAALPPKVWSSTLAVDASLSAFCRQLYPHWAQYKRRKGAA